MGLPSFHRVLLVLGPETQTELAGSWLAPALDCIPSILAFCPDIKPHLRPT